jgi:hypothetical protein
VEAAALDVWLLWSAVGVVVVVVVVVEVVVVPGWLELAVADDCEVAGVEDILSGVAAAEVLGVLAADEGAEEEGPELAPVQWSATSVTLLIWRVFAAFAFAAVEALALDPEVELLGLEPVLLESGVDALLALLAALAS